MANDICGWSKVASTKTKPLLALAMFAVCALAWGQSDRTGTLTAPARFPLIMDGKQVGSSTAAAGTKVTILKEEGGKLLVSGPAGQTWLASEMVTPSSPPPPKIRPQPGLRNHRNTRKRRWRAPRRFQIKTARRRFFLLPGTASTNPSGRLWSRLKKRELM